MKEERIVAETIVLKVGDAIGYHSNDKAVIEKIRVISTGKFIEQVKYDGENDDIVLTLRDGAGICSLWLKDNPVRILEEKKEKGRALRKK
ncbi:MAG: hypothetical protein NTY76_05770 [Candidatus Omnitrophica bacterium]|nr:hypothetical protein [Candidatus Omnitrophota bacterium]